MSERFRFSLKSLFLWTTLSALLLAECAALHPNYPTIRRLELLANEILFLGLAIASTRVLVAATGQAAAVGFVCFAAMRWLFTEPDAPQYGARLLHATLIRDWSDLMGFPASERSF